jgi:hypothetical protein
MVDRIVERTDGVNSERVTETPSAGGTTVIERRGGGGGILIGLALIVAVVIGALYLINQNNREAVKTDAITSAAKSVEKGADKVGAAAQDAGESVAK